MFFAINAAGHVFVTTRSGFDGYVVVWKKSANEYKVFKAWGHGRFFLIGGIVITTDAADGDHEVVCVCDRRCVQTFRPDGSFLRLFGTQSIPSDLATGFAAGNLYVVDHAGEKILVFGLDDTLRFCIRVPRICDLAVLGDELFVLAWPDQERSPRTRKLDLFVYSAHDGTRLRRITAFVDPFTLIRASPSDGLLWLLSSTDGAKRMKPDFTLLQPGKRMHTSESEKNTNLRNGLVWHEGKAIGLTYDGSPVPLDLGEYQ